MNKLLKNYLYNLAYQMFVIIVPLVSMPYLARVLHAENLGIYSYVTTCASVINTVGLLGLYNYGNRQIAYTRDAPEAVRDSFNELISLRIILCVISTVVYFALAATTEYTRYFLIYYPWLLAGFVDISWFFSGVEDMGPMVFKNFLIKLLSVIGIFVFVRNEEDLGNYFANVAVITLAANAAMYFQLRGRTGRFQFRLKNLKKHVSEAILLFLPQLATMFYLQIDKVMLKTITGSAVQLAYYDQAEKTVNIPFTVITALSVVMMPRIAHEFKKGKQESVAKHVAMSAKFSFMLSSPLMLGLAAIADNFIPWYLGKEFFPVIQAIWLLCPLVMSNAIMNITGTQYLTAVNQVKGLTISHVAAAILNIGANAVLIPVLGFRGPAIATVISSVVCVMIQLSYTKKSIQIRPMFATIWKYFLSAAIMFVGVRAASARLEPSFTNTCLLIATGITIYACMMWLLRDEFFLTVCKTVKGLMTRRRSGGD